jgi:predicted PurR-regulated permease PerM
MTTAGAMLGGIVGIILAMPVAGILSILLENPDSRPSKKLP